MSRPHPPPRAPERAAEIGAFIARWNGTERAERANYSPFLTELCGLIGVQPPAGAVGGGGDYRFERTVTHHEIDGTETARRIDLYRRGCFVLEAKQGANPKKQRSLFALSEAERRANVRRSAGWAQAMLRARGQAEGYARDLPAAEGYPPFLIVCDVGFCIDLYADFSGTGKHYAQFPDRESFRVYLPDLHDSAVRERLRLVWADPHALDPARRRVRITRDIAALLAKLARALEANGNPAQQVASFLMRCIFCMFAQSVGLLPSRTTFSELLESCRPDLPRGFIVMLGELWRTMNAGGYSAALHATVRRFNGGLFGTGVHGPIEPLAIDADMLDLLLIAANHDWADVEPAIFGTLLENALDSRQRGELGAHFTPRAVVERLVLPTVMEPLRGEWDGVKVAATQLAEADRAAATKLVAEFHARLCQIRVLDPACGTGNFLYVTLELMKRLEGEVLDLLADLAAGEGDRLAIRGASVDPHQFLGLEKNPRAVPVAELVLWIGYLQWHFRTRGSAPPAEPILRDFRNIREADALLSYTEEVPERGERGAPITRWDGSTFKLHPITGEDVPDETAREVVLRPVGAKPATWPDADFIVGKDMRAELGDGYAKSLWAAYPKIPRSADLVMFFWWKAAELVRAAKPDGPRRFGFIGSNSIRQTFSRRVIAAAIEEARRLHLVFAIPDHPWADGAGTAAVRIAMTVGERWVAQSRPGRLVTVMAERPVAEGAPEVELLTREGTINADLTLGVDVTAARPLRSNERLCCPGMKLHGAGFIVSPATAGSLGLGKVSGLDRHIRPYLNGRDLTQRSRGQMVIDLFGLIEQGVRTRFPAVYQHIILRVKPEREQNNRTSYRDSWWIFGEPRRELRPALKGLSRYIVTVETARHRPFVFVSGEVLPDNRLVCVASDDALILGVLSSRLHTAWSLLVGARLEDRPIYTKTACFDPFPFPAPTAAQASSIRALAEELDSHRMSRLTAHPQLTLTQLYNVLEALRANRPLTAAERDIHDAGLVTILRDLHDRLDAAVAAAYGWPADLPDQEILVRLVALNAERRAEEEAGTIRWLRPEFQAPQDAARRATQRKLVIEQASVAEPHAWPKRAPDQYIALRAALSDVPATPADVARRFAKAPRGRMKDMLEALVAMGQARRIQDGRYVG